MTFQGFCLPFRCRFVFFFVGIAFLGAVSAPLHAADSPAPSTWDKLFGNTSKATENAPKEQKPQKVRASKEAPKKHKNPKSKKASAETEPENKPETKAETKAEASAETTAAPSTNQTSPAPELPSSGKTEASGPKVETSTPFWKSLFSGASSSSPEQEGVTQGNPPQPSSGAVNSPPANPSTTATPTPAIIEPSNSEPFWKRLFGGASPKQPESKPGPAAALEPAKESALTPPALEATSAEPSFWQKLFGNKTAEKKVGPNAIKSTEAPIEQSTAVPVLPSTTLATPTTPAIPTSPAIPVPSTTKALSLPITVAPTPSTIDAKANFSLTTVCEREKCELMILFDAPIIKANVDKFIQSTASIPAGTVVLLNSTDGDLNSGLRLGQVLRQKYFNTRIGQTQLSQKTLNEIDGQCYSACVLAFAGGVNRRIDPNDKIGIYALRSSTKTVNENEMKTAVNNLGIYFDQMGVDRRLVDQMLQTKGSSVSLISLSNAKLLNLDNGTRIVTYPWRMQALDDGLLIILVTEKQASNYFSITLGLTKQAKDKDFRLTIYAKPLSGNPNLNQLADYLNRDARLQLVFRNQMISPSLIKPWEATGNGIQTAIPITDKELMAMSSALEFELDLLQIQNNPYKLDGATIFGTSGLKGALAAIKK
jgi:hypothetical protein